MNNFIFGFMFVVSFVVTAQMLLSIARHFRIRFLFDIQNVELIPTVVPQILDMCYLNRL